MDTKTEGISIGAEIPLSLEWDSKEDIGPLDFLPLIRKIGVGKSNQFFVRLDGKIAQFRFNHLGVSMSVMVTFDAIGNANGLNINIEENVGQSGAIRKSSFNLSRGNA